MCSIVGRTRTGLAARCRHCWRPFLPRSEHALERVVRRRGVLLTTYGMVQHNAEALAAHARHDPDEGPLWDVMICGERVGRRGGVGGTLRRLVARGSPCASTACPCRPLHAHLRLRLPASAPCQLIRPPAHPRAHRADEGHKLKNPRMQLRQKLDALPCGLRVIISGTPIQVQAAGAAGALASPDLPAVRAAALATQPFHAAALHGAAFATPSPAPRAPAEQPAGDVGALQLRLPRPAGRRARLPVGRRGPLARLQGCKL